LQIQNRISKKDYAIGKCFNVGSGQENDKSVLSSPIGIILFF